MDSPFEVCRPLFHLFTWQSALRTYDDQYTSAATKKEDRTFTLCHGPLSDKQLIAMLSISEEKSHEHLEIEYCSAEAALSWKAIKLRLGIRIELHQFH